MLGEMPLAGAQTACGNFTSLVHVCKPLLVELITLRGTSLQAGVAGNTSMDPL